MKILIISQFGFRNQMIEFKYFAFHQIRLREREKDGEIVRKIEREKDGEIVRKKERE